MQVERIGWSSRLAGGLGAGLLALVLGIGANVGPWPAPVLAQVSTAPGSGECSHADITRAVTAVLCRPPLGESDAGECDWRAYDAGRWASYEVGFARIRAAHGLPADAPIHLPAGPPPTGPQSAAATLLPRRHETANAVFLGDAGMAQTTHASLPPAFTG